MVVKTKPTGEPGAGGEPPKGEFPSDAILFGRPSAWALRPEGSEVRMAPGAPGAPPTWASAAKVGVGTASAASANSTSLVWFTLAKGALTEIYHPRVDRACTRDLGLIITDGSEFFSDERDAADHEVELPIDGVPLYRLVNTCRQGRYRIEKTIFTHPSQSAVLQVTRFVPLKGVLEAYRLYALLAPHLDNRGAGNSAWLGVHQGVPMLFARRGGSNLAMACSAPWLAGSAGFVGVSDGWRDLSRHKRLAWRYDRAEGGNVAMTGEVDLAAGDGRFVLAVGFGASPAEAGHRALASLQDDPEALRAEYVRGWLEWQATLEPPKPVAGPGGRDLYRTSAAVLRTHEARNVPGAFVASLSTPWGESRGDEAKERGTGGYHLVWPRDLAESAGGLLAAGAKDDALRALAYLRATQTADGHWPQNQWVGSTQYWTGIQIGETAFPILLLDMLRRDGALSPADLARYWPMVRRAVEYVARNGPSTPQDRWEGQPGYNTFTVAVVIAALLAAADLADDQGERNPGGFLRETADAWNSALESWLYVVGTDLARRVGVEGYYARSVAPDLDERATPRIGHVELDGGTPAEIVSPDALALVRFGLRAPDDPRIVNTARVIDSVLKVETPRGPAWLRFQGDDYGEKSDGSPYDEKWDGRGRPWPLLVGERAHYELAAGRRDEAVRLLRVLESFAGDGGMIPEQVWDSDAVPERGLFPGGPTGSAMPLAWAHAEYLKLRRSIRDDRVFDQPAGTTERYLKRKTGSRLAIWRFEHPRRAVSAGETLRVQTLAAAVVHWTRDGWKTAEDVETRDSGLGVHFVDLDLDGLKPGDVVGLTFRWPDADRWEGRNFTVDVV